MRRIIKEEWKKDMGWESIADEYLKCYQESGEWIRRRVACVPVESGE